MLVGDRSFHCRVVVIGNSSVGKTSLLNQLVDHTFKEFEQSTVGANYQLFVQEINGVKVEIQIWDTAGQERFRSLGPIYFRNSFAAVAVFDQTNRQSFDDLPEWIDSFTAVAGSETIICVAANKCDLIEETQVSSEEVEKWAKDNGYLFGRTSAKTGEGVPELFMSLAKSLMSFQNSKNKTSVVISPRNDKGGCC